MREIKFRAWDKVQQRMLAPACPMFNGGIAWGEGGGCYDSSQEGFVVEQFTGLKDRNGQDVYEGDILKCLDSMTPDEFVTNEVRFCAGAFVLWCGEKGYIPLFWILRKGWDDRMEVVGNIHENPEIFDSSVGEKKS